jgi:RHS repeat-associated protein
MLKSKHGPGGPALATIFLLFHRGGASGQLAVEQDAILAGGFGRLYHYDEFGRMTHQVKMAITSAMGVFDNDGNTWIEDADKWAVFDYFLSGGNNKTEKRWMYDTYDPSFNYAPNALEYLNNSLSNTKGNLVQTVSYNLADDPIEFKFLSYNNDGFLKWEMTQFNQNGMSNGTGMVIRIDYPEYNLQGSNLLQNIDLDGDHTLDFQYAYEYDEWNRIENVYANYDGAGTGGNLIVNYKYNDDKGVVCRKKYYHSETNDMGAILCKNEEIDSITYNYDERIRLNDITSTFFDWNLFYDANTIGVQDENFNGNINATKGTYKFGDALNPPTSFATESQYAYSYDGMNRLIQADAELKEDGLIVAPTWGNTSYSYDKIGNFTNLQRIAKGASPSILISTDYTYNYQSANNKLATITKPNGGIDRSISYDANGNLLSDTKRGISSTSYGRANLPWTQSVNGNGNKYLYDINDARIYKLGVQQGIRGAATVSEFYLRDAGGRELAIYNFNTNKLSWFVHGNERVARIDHHSDYKFDTPAIPPCQCDPRTDPRCRDKIIRGAGFYDKNQINLSDANNTRLINLATSLVDCNDPSPPDTPDRTFYNTTIHYVTKTDQSEDYVRDNDMGSLQAGYTIEGTMQIRSRHQQFMMALNSGQEVPVSIEEMLGLADPNPPNIGYAGAGDPYLDPLREMTNAPAVSASYYIHDHLGNTRIVYHYSCDDNPNLQGYTLEHVMDYYPYGKMLQEYKYGTALSERYLTTHHERDIESGLDYRGARFYDSDIGRFLSLDPLAADFPAFSDYNYVLGNPVSLVDKDGRTPLVAVIVGAVVGAITEIIATIGIDMYDNGVGINTAVNNIDPKMVASAALWGGVSTLWGETSLSKFGTFISKPRNRRVMRKLVRTGVDLFINSVENITKQYVGSDEPIDVTKAVFDALVAMNLSKLIPSSKYYGRQANRAKRKMGRAEQKMSRKNWKNKSEKYKEKVRGKFKRAQNKYIVNSNIEEVLPGIMGEAGSNSEANNHFYNGGWQIILPEMVVTPSSASGNTPPFNGSEN